MHELPIITRVLDLALEAAPEGSLIVRVNLRVGALCDAEPLWLERYFRTAARGTRAENASLIVQRDRARPPSNAASPAGASNPDFGTDFGASFGYTLESIEVRDSEKGTET